MNKKLDLVLINPGDRKQVYQDLGQDLAGVEPPFWIAVIAAYLRNQGIKLTIIDANVLNITPKETAELISKFSPLCAAVIVYGSQPSASTQNMTVAGQICDEISNLNICKVAIGGLHPTALPRQTMKEENIDFLIEGEGLYTLENLIKQLKCSQPQYNNVPGLWYRENEKILHTKKPPNIKVLDEMLPTGAWDLLPMEKYRAHNWHCFDDITNREPYGAIYTSLGCPYSCVFCCINALFGKPGIRYRSPDRVLQEIEELSNKHNVKNLKIVDELFVLKENHYMSIVEGIIKKRLDVNIWAYARVDTINYKNLPKMKKAGINWLALGIESANPDVRDGALKKMRVQDIKNVVRRIQEAGIYIIGNYIFGLPDDTLETMEETLDLAIDLNCEFANFYSAMAYPGSKLYDIAIKNNWRLPDQWHGYSQHSYNTLPLPTKHLNAEAVLKFRDTAFHKYFNNAKYLTMIENKFGKNVKNHIMEMSKHHLKRKILEN